MSSGKLLSGRVALITGGSRGLGRALCEVFAREGASIAFNYASDGKAAEETLAGLDTPNKRAFKCSVLDRPGIEQMVSAIEADLGPIAILVNNAGVTEVMPFAMLEEEDWDEVMDINVKGTYLVTRAVARSMIRRRYGRIVNIGSLAGFKMIDAPVHYCTSKAAIQGFTLALAKELARYEILVNCIAPGLLDEGVGLKLPETKLADYVKHCGLRRPGTCAEIAELAAFVCSERNSYMSGAVLLADGALG
ncbi:MAG: SDR family NAD(P)-dependent oxidoreductase [Myxococcales bacterium]|nr:SDR family NAD(P)-dependent oxidoreductase [Myxococcales bacterium]